MSEGIKEELREEEEREKLKKTVSSWIIISQSGLKKKNNHYGRVWQSFLDAVFGFSDPIVAYGSI